jgi:pimeloyl-ACP methyl ester carboxylesterase
MLDPAQSFCGLLCALALACGEDTAATLSFSPCGESECAELEVPLNYSDPMGERLTLAVKRRPATGGQRIGSLLINPGGPGGSAVDFLDVFVSDASPALLARFDIVALDPRGVGKSAPLDCHSSIQQLAALDPSPDSEQEWTSTDAISKAFADECAQKHSEVLPHLGTRNVARDMDQLRVALGEEKLTYVGYSYGTILGATYVDMFPHNVRAAVLDGAVDLSLSALDRALAQAVAFETSLHAYFDWCDAGNDCAWASGSAPADAFTRLSDELDTTSLPTDYDRPLGPGEFLFGILMSLYSGEKNFSSISSALSDAAAGDGSHLLWSADQLIGRNLFDGTYSNSQEVMNAVNCLDSPVPDSAGLRADQARFEESSATFGLPLLTGLFVCAHWPAQPASPLTVPKAAGAPPILVIGTTGDPATPFAWAEALASQLESGVLLAQEGGRHVAYLRSTPCIDETVDAYLLDGKVPEAGKRCGSEPQ